VLGKLNLKTLTIYDIFGIVKSQTESHEIGDKVLATSQLLANMLLPETCAPVDRVTGRMRELGHQLEEELAANELSGEHCNKVQRGDKLYNQTDMTRLSEVRVLDNMALIKVRDARIEKDEKKKKARGLAKGKSGATTPVRVRKGRLKLK